MMACLPLQLNPIQMLFYEMDYFYTTRKQQFGVKLSSSHVLSWQHQMPQYQQTTYIYVSSTTHPLELLVVSWVGDGGCR